MSPVWACDAPLHRIPAGTRHALCRGTDGMAAVTVVGTPSKDTVRSAQKARDNLLRTPGTMSGLASELAETVLSLDL